MRIVTQEAVQDGGTVRPVTQACFLNALCEQTYDPASEEVAFAVRIGGKQSCGLPFYDVSARGLRLVPLKSPLIEKGRLILPSRPEPHGSTAQVIADIGEFLDRYVVLPVDSRPFVPYYILFTWIYDRFATVPYLRFIGDLGVGKSRALEAVGSLCYHPFFGAGSASNAALFRAMEMFGKFTLVMDEVDFFSRNEAHWELMTMFRQGFENKAGVLRAEKSGDTYVPTDYSVFGPKVLAGRKNFPDPALESRCMRVYMQSGIRHDHVPVDLPRAFKSEVIQLQNKLLSWRLENFFKPLQEPERLAVESRLMQVYSPLAKVVAGDAEASQILKQAILGLQEELTEHRQASLEGRVLGGLLAEVNGEDLATEHRILLSAVAQRAAAVDGHAPTSKRVRAVCQGFGLKSGPRVGAGATVLFNPSEHQALIRQYGLEEEPEVRAA